MISNEMTFLTSHTSPDLSGSGVDKQIVNLLNRCDRMNGCLAKQILLVKMLLTQSNVDLVNNEIVNLDKLLLTRTNNTRATSLRNES